MRIHVLPRVHQVLLIFFILQIVFSSVVCENTDDRVEKGQQPGAGGQPPQSQDSTIMENMLATFQRIKAISPQVLKRVLIDLPKAVTGLLYNYILWKSQNPSLKRQNAFRIRSDSNIDPPPVEYGGVPVELDDENEAEIAIRGEPNRPALHQDWDSSQPIAEAPFQAEYLPDPIPTEQYTFHAQEADPEDPDEHEHDKNVDATPANNNPLYSGQYDDSMGTLEQQPDGPPQPDNNPTSYAYESDANEQGVGRQDQMDYVNPPTNTANEPSLFHKRLKSLWLKEQPTNEHSTSPPAEPPTMVGYGSGGGYDDGSGESNTGRTDITTFSKQLIEIARPLLKANRDPNAHFSGVNSADSYTDSNSQYTASQEYVDDLMGPLSTYYGASK